MKKILILAAVVALASCQNSAEKIAIRQVSDRGFISALYVQGNDTLEYHYLTKAEYDSIFNVGSEHYICPDCDRTGCIYAEINGLISDNKNMDVMKAILIVCERRKVTGSKAVDRVIANYYSQLFKIKQ